MPDPEESEVLEYFEKLSNWGRWGKDDVLGTLNFITPEKRVAASKLVRTGEVVSCAYDIDTAPHIGDMMPAQRFIVRSGEGAWDTRQGFTWEFLGLVYHGKSVTHLDALSHMSWDRKIYNGLPAESVTGQHGAVAMSVTDVKQGIVTRGVLVDVARHRGVDWVPSKERITGDELRATLEEENVVLEEGDVLLMRTGYAKKVATTDFENMDTDGPAGWHVSCLHLFHEAGIAAIGVDMNNDLADSGYPSIIEPIHAVSLIAMGLRIIDNCNFEALAAKCVERDTWTFQFVLSPLSFIGATGSPVNPLAIF